MTTEHERDLTGQRLLFELPTNAVSDDKERLAKRQDGRKSPQPDVAALLTVISTALESLADRIGGIEAMLQELHASNERQAVEKEFYTTAEIAKLLGKRPYTVREWCRLCRVRAERTHAGRGHYDEWRIAHAELVRLQNEGLLPVVKPSQMAVPRRLPR